MRLRVSSIRPRADWSANPANRRGRPGRPVQCVVDRSEPTQVNGYLYQTAHVAWPISPGWPGKPPPVQRCGNLP